LPIVREQDALATSVEEAWQLSQSYTKEKRKFYIPPHNPIPPSPDYASYVTPTANTLCQVALGMFAPMKIHAQAARKKGGNGRSSYSHKLPWLYKWLYSPRGNPIDFLTEDIPVDGVLVELTESRIMEDRDYIIVVSILLLYKHLKYSKALNPT
jgi:hypothetical protein